MCPECGGPEHEPENCPEAIWYHDGGTNGACEHWFLQYCWEGQVLAVRLAIGDVTEEEFYELLTDGVDEMHSVSECGLLPTELGEFYADACRSGRAIRAGSVGSLAVSVLPGLP